MKRIFFFCLSVFFLLSAFSLKAQKAVPTRVAYFDIDSMLSIMPEMQKATAEANTFWGKMETELYQMQVELDKKKNEYDTNSTWTPVVKKIKGEEIQALQERSVAFTGMAKTEYEEFRKQLIDPIMAKINAAAKAVAAERGYDIVLDSSKSAGMVVFVNGKDDIFNAVRIKLGVPSPGGK